MDCKRISIGRSDQLAQAWARASLRQRTCRCRDTDPKVLDQLVWAKHDGSRGEGCSSANERFPEDQDGEAEHCRREKRRALLLAACAGCEDTLNRLLKISNGEVSYFDLAQSLVMNNGQVWRTVQQYMLRIRKTISLAEAAIACIERGDGFTLSPTGLPVIRVDAWTVSLGGDLGVRYPTRPDLIQVTAFIATRYSILFGRASNHLGGWLDHDNGEYCLDVSRLIREKAKALAFARRQNQKAVTHLGTLLTIPVVNTPREKRRKAA